MASKLDQLEKKAANLLEKIVKETNKSDAAWELNIDDEPDHIALTMRFPKV